MKGYHNGISNALPLSPLRLIYFVVVGVVACLVHIVTVLGLVSLANMQALAANLLAFLLAFNCSYWGHKHLTFAQMEQKKLRLPRFFLIAVSSGILNESIYFLLLEKTNMHYLAALIIVLACVSVYTFILSKFWATC